MDFITNIIGLTSTDTTLSGLYVDDTTPGRIPLAEAFYQESTPQANLIEEAFFEALRRLRIVTEKRLTKNYSPARATIGNVSTWSSYISGLNDLKYLAIVPKLRGLTLRINEVKIHLESGVYAGQFWIYRGDTVVYTNMVDGEIEAFTDQTIDMTENIYIVYSDSARPKNFTHNTCCGKSQAYKSLVMVGAHDVASLTDMGYYPSTHTNGIEVKCYIDCDGFKFISELDFEENVFGIVFAKLVQQIARYNLGYWIMTNNKVTPYAMVKEEELTVILEYLKNDIETNLNFLPEVYDHSDCYVCSGMYKSEILI